MTGSTETQSSTGGPGGAPNPTAPGNRVQPKLVVAVAVAALMLLGLAGLLAAALLGDREEPSGDGLRPSVNVDEPATAPPGTADPEAADTDPPGSTEPAPAGSAPSAGPPAEGEPEGDDSGGGDDDFSDEPTITTVVAVLDIDQPDGSDLPEPSGGPVELPVQVTTPPPPSTYPATPVEALEPDAIEELTGWSVGERDTDHVVFTDDGEVVELFVLTGVATADEALARFADDVAPDLEELTRSPVARLGAPSGRFESVAGAEYTATAADQQGTATMSGSIVAAVRPDGTAVVLTTSRAGSSSAEELAADGALLVAILAHL